MPRALLLLDTRKDKHYMGDTRMEILQALFPRVKIDTANKQATIDGLVVARYAKDQWTVDEFVADVACAVIGILVRDYGFVFYTNASTSRSL